MSVRRLAAESIQPKDFAFTAENTDWAKGQIAKYPPGRQASAVIPLLWKAQEQAGGWTPRKAIEEVAAMLDMPFIRVMEIATFYTMFNLSPVGRHHVQLCGTVPCHVCGAIELKAVCEQRIGPQGTVSAGGKFSWIEVECLGACCNAPMVQIGYDYYEDLTPENFGKLLDDLAAGRPVKTGSQTGRSGSEPQGGGATLTDAALFDGSQIGAWKKRFAEEAMKLVGEPVQEKPAAAAPAASSGPAVPGAGGSVHVPQPAAPKDLPVAPAGSAIANAVPADEPGADHAPGDSSGAHAEHEAVARREEAEIAEKLAALPKDATALDKANAVGEKPKGLETARGDAADNLQRIKGVGKVNEGRLHDLGIFHFDQIAHWTRAEIRWVGTYLAFPGRIDRENWVGQATILAAGGDIGKKPGEPHPERH
ncbi:NADH dehydrogenase subunit E [Rhizobiales bacterium GAS113]|jgi:NADH-quinone oxidoreductase subunit E|nr:NADH dehydrogenase subunit E [Rhizobiales bacterium GAS113]